jgi:hypothetical protein
MLWGIDVCLAFDLRSIGLQEFAIIIKMLICLIFGIFA